MQLRVPSRLVLSAASFLMLLLACGGGSVSESEAPAVAPVLADGTEVNGTHTVRCGCVVEDVGHCGNYVDIEGRAYAITGDVSLGKMEWCAVDSATATVAGTIQAGQLVATSVMTIDE